MIPPIHLDDDTIKYSDGRDINRAANLRQRRQYPRPAARALVETRKIILLVRRMDAVVVESESDQQRVDAKMPLEVGYNRDRAAGTYQKRLLAPFLGQSGPRFGELRAIPIERNRGCTGVVNEFGRTIGREVRAHEGAECIADFRWVLLADQTERDFGGGFGRNHGFRSRPAITTRDAVDVASRPRGDLLDDKPTLLASRRREAHLPEEFFRR